MEFEIVYYNCDENFAKNFEKFNELVQVLKSIPEHEIINAFVDMIEIDKKAEKKRGEKSISKPINCIIKQYLENYGWESEKPIFKDDVRIIKRTLDFAAEDLAVEVGFNHGEAKDKNLINLQLSGSQHNLEKRTNSKLGVLISVTKKMKVAGNFDGAVGSFEDIKRNIMTLDGIMTVPFVLIGLKAPQTFLINESKEVIMING